jgi:imidazolonepropionase-like amidohydrolase
MEIALLAPPIVLKAGLLVAGAEALPVPSGMVLVEADRIRSVFGKDAAHGHPAEEAPYAAKADMSPRDILRALTEDAAELMRLGSEVGRIAPGMRADLVALEGNPLEDVGAFSRVRFVMKAGRVYRNHP